MKHKSAIGPQTAHRRGAISSLQSKQRPLEMAEHTCLNEVADKVGSVLLRLAVHMPLTMSDLMIYLASSSSSSMQTHQHSACRYEDALKQTLMLGGDTDTNAAIVGSVLGALWGAAAIPAWISGAVLLPAIGKLCDHGCQGQPIQFLQGDRLLPTAEALLSMAESFRELRRVHEKRQPGTTPHRRSWGESVKSWVHR